MSAQIKKHPAWKQALEDFRAAGYVPGDIVTFDWLYGHFELEKPQPATPWGKAEKMRLLFLRHIESFTDRLSDEFQLELESVPGVGYRIILPQEQTAWADAEGYAGLRRSMRKWARRLRNVQLEALSDEQRRQNADSQAKLSAFAGMVRRQRLIPHAERGLLTIAPE